VENSGRAGQAADDNIKRRMRMACWITGATHSEYVILLLFHDNNVYANAPQRYVIRILSVSLNTQVGEQEVIFE
jgi:hypothetical protein